MPDIGSLSEKTERMATLEVTAFRSEELLDFSFHMMEKSKFSVEIVFNSFVVDIAWITVRITLLRPSSA
jgi:hypothetical protein